MRKIDHAIGKMMLFVCPCISQFFQDGKKNLKMMILFGCCYDNGLVKFVIVILLLCKMKVLGDINRSSISAQNNLFAKMMKTLVRIVGKINKQGAVRIFFKHSFLDSLFNNFFCEVVEIAFVVVFIKENAEFFIGIFKSAVCPGIHELPQCTNLFVALLPLDQHLLCFLFKLGVFFQFF